LIVACGNSDPVKRDESEEQTKNTKNSDIVIEDKDNANSDQDYYSLANTRMSEGKYWAAVNLYTKAIELNPENFEAIYKRGIANLKVGDYWRAIKDFDTTLKDNPNNSNAYYYRGVANHEVWKMNKTERDNLDLAIIDYKAATEMNPDNSDAHKQLLKAEKDIDSNYSPNANIALEHLEKGKNMAGAGQSLQAIKEFDKAIELNSNLVIAYIERAKISAEQKRYHDCIRDNSKAIEINPEHVDIYRAYNNRGSCKRGSRDISGAKTDFESALRHHYALWEAHYNLGKIKEQMKDFRSASKHFDNVITYHPKEQTQMLANVYKNSGLVKMKINDFMGALDAFNNAISIKFVSPRDMYFAYNSRGLVKQYLKDYQGAISDYDMAISTSSRYPNAHINKEDAIKLSKSELGAEDYFGAGNKASRNKDWISALKEYHLAIMLEPDNAEYYIARAIATYEALQRNDLSGQENQLIHNFSYSEDLDKAIMIEPNNYELYLIRAKYNPNTRIDDLNIVIKNNPENAIAYFYRGKATSKLMYVGSIKDAMPDFNKAIELEPNNTEFLLERGESREKIGEIDSAIKDYIKVAKLETDNVDIYIKIAEANVLKEDFNKAIENYDKAIELNPSDTDLLIKRGYIKIRSGNTQDGCSDLYKAHELGNRIAFVNYENHCN